MEENNEKRIRGLIRFTIFMALVLVSQIGLFVLICALQGGHVNIGTVILFIAGIIGTTVSYMITVSGGVPLPGPKK
jgi:uncharacterized membrane protein